MIGADIFNNLRQQGLVRNTSDFSVNWCGMSSSYYTRRKGNLTNNAKINLWRKLLEEDQKELAEKLYNSIFGENR